MHNAYKNIDEYNIDKEQKILIAFDDVISDMINNKKLNWNIMKLKYGSQIKTVNH